MRQGERSMGRRMRGIPYLSASVYHSKFKIVLGVRISNRTLSLSVKRMVMGQPELPTKVHYKR